MPMRAVFMTLTQARRAPVSICMMRRTVPSSFLSSAGVLFLMPTATMMMGLRSTCWLAPSSLLGSAPMALNQRLTVLSVLPVAMRSARAVRGICSGCCRSSASCAPVW